MKDQSIIGATAAILIAIILICGISGLVDWICKNVPSAVVVTIGILCAFVLIMFGFVGNRSITKEILIVKLEEIVAEKNSHNNGYHYEVKISDWANYGKSRTYFSYIETRGNSKHYVIKKFGYWDNQTGMYCPEKYGNLEN